MTAVRLLHWDFRGSEEKQFSDLLESTRSLDCTNQGLLYYLIQKRISEQLDIICHDHPAEFQKILYSFAIYGFSSEFLGYEFVKNSHDAKAGEFNVYLKTQPTENTVVSTFIDNGKGFTDYLKKPERAKWVREDGALAYIRLIDPIFDPNKPESSSNRFTENKLSSDKVGQDLSGQNALGLRSVAILGLRTKSQFWLIDAPKFKQSPELKKLTGITDDNIPDHGAVFIFISPKYSKDALKEFKEKDAVNALMKKGSICHNFYLDINKALNTSVADETDCDEDENEELFILPTSTPDITETPPLERKIQPSSSLLTFDYAELQRKKLVTRKRMTFLQSKSSITFTQSDAPVLETSVSQRIAEIEERTKNYGKR